MEESNTESKEREEAAANPGAATIGSLVEEALKAFLRPIIEGAVKAEFDEFMELRNSDPDGDKDYRNGYYERVCKTGIVPSVSYRMPRDRNNEFESKIVKPYQTRAETIDEMVCGLYSKGLTISEIREYMERQYGKSLSAGLIEKLVSSMYRGSVDFNERKLDDYYPILVIDGIHLPLKRAFPGGRKDVEKECLMVVLGVNSHGNKEILAFDWAANEGAYSWEGLLKKLRERAYGGKPDPKVVVSDGLQGMPEALGRVFPAAKHQRCLVHVMRNISNRVRKKYQKEALDDFKKVYNAGSREEGEKALEGFVGKWGGTYPSFRNYLDEKEQLLCFYGFPKPLWKFLYTSNNIENFNTKMRREASKRISFNSSEGASYCIANVCLSFNEHCSRKVIRGYKELTAKELEEMGFKY